MPQLRQHQQLRRISQFAAALALFLPALAATPVQLSAQLAVGRPSLPPGTVLEGYVARAVLDPAVVGTRARVAGAGARLLFPLRALTDALPDGLARRVAVGGFVTAVPAEEDEVEARHYGVQADVRLRDAAVAGRVEPLLSLGVGTLESRRVESGGERLETLCLAVTDAPVTAFSHRCVRTPAARRTVGGSYLAVSPAAGVRIGLLPNLGLRADVRDAIVYRDGARHNLELGTGLSFVW